MQPQYLVLDEPTAGLDPKGRQEFLELLQCCIGREGRLLWFHIVWTILLGMHKKMIVMEHGQIKLSGTPQEVFSHPVELEQIGVGVPTLTKLLLHLKERGFHVRTDLFNVNEVKKEILTALSERKGGNPC